MLIQGGKRSGGETVLAPCLWLNKVFAHALAIAIQRAHKVNTAIILFAQCPRYLHYFSLYSVIEHRVFMVLLFYY